MPTATRAANGEAAARRIPIGQTTTIDQRIAAKLAVSPVDLGAWTLLPINSVLTDGIVVTVTPALANRILQECNYDRQRALRHRHRNRISRQMQDGSWIHGYQLHFASLLGRLIMVDGQHRLHAVIDSGTAYNFRVMITPVSNEGELNNLYNRIDRTHAPRNDSDLLRAENVMEDFDLSVEVANGAFRAIKIISSGFTLGVCDLSDRDILQLGDDVWFPVARRYELCIKNAAGRLNSVLKRPSIMAVALATLDGTAGSAAEDFWYGVAQNKSDGRGDARGTLALHLMSWRRGQAWDLMNAASSAWNAFFEGRKHYRVRSVRRTKETAGPTILGTPWDNWN